MPSHLNSCVTDFTRKFKFILQTDASDQGLGAVLCQEQVDGKLRPVAYASRGLTKDELKYHTQEKEALGIIWACEKFRPYLMGETFVTETDHGSLQWLLGNQKGRLARWAMRLSEFDFTIKPKPGKNNGNADAPSRFPVDKPDEMWSPEDSAPDYTDLIGPVNVAICNLTTDRSAAMVDILSVEYEELSVNTTTVEPESLGNEKQTLRQLLIKAQRQDRALEAIRAYLVDQSVPTISKEILKEYPKSKIARMSIDPTDGLIVISIPAAVFDLSEEKRRKPVSLTTIKKAVVPGSLRTEILRLCHKAPFGAHFGRTKVTRCGCRILRHGMWRTVCEYIRRCRRCQQFKNAPRPFLKVLRVRTEEDPFGCIAIDCIVELPLTARGNKNILVISDMFTKWPEAFPLASKTAEAVADALFSFVCRHGLPRKIQSDQGPEFINKVISRLMDRLEVVHATTTPYNPQANGAVENFNKTLMASLRTYACDENMMNWDRFLDGVLFAYRVAKHASTQISPFALVYGRQARLPTSILEPDNVEFTNDIKEYNTRHVYELHKAYQNVRAVLDDARMAYKRYYDRRIPGHAKESEFAVGDK